MPTTRSDVFHNVDADQLIAGDHRTAVEETLVTVDNPAMVHPDRRVVSNLSPGLHRDDHRESRWRHHIAVAERTSGLRVVVGGIRRTDRRRELTDLLSPD